MKGKKNRCASHEKVMRNTAFKLTKQQASPAGKVLHLPAVEVVEHCVDCKVAAQRVLLGRAKLRWK